MNADCQRINDGVIKMAYTIGIAPFSSHVVRPDINNIATSYNMGMNLGIMIPYNENRKLFITLCASYFSTYSLYKLPVSKNLFNYSVGITNIRKLYKKIYYPVSLCYVNTNFQENVFTNYKSYNGIGVISGIGYKRNNSFITLSNARNYLIDFKNFSNQGNSSIYLISYTYGI